MSYLFQFFAGLLVVGVLALLVLGGGAGKLGVYVAASALLALLGFLILWIWRALSGVGRWARRQ